MGLHDDLESFAPQFTALVEQGDWPPIIAAIEQIFRDRNIAAFRTAAHFAFRIPPDLARRSSLPDICLKAAFADCHEIRRAALLPIRHILPHDEAVTALLAVFRAFLLTDPLLLPGLITEFSWRSQERDELLSQMVAAPAPMTRWACLQVLVGWTSSLSDKTPDDFSRALQCLEPFLQDCYEPIRLQARYWVARSQAQRDHEQEMSRVAAGQIRPAAGTIRRAEKHYAALCKRIRPRLLFFEVDERFRGHLTLTRRLDYGAKDLEAFVDLLAQQEVP